VQDESGGNLVKYCRRGGTGDPFKTSLVREGGGGRDKDLRSKSRGRGFNELDWRQIFPEEKKGMYR